MLKDDEIFETLESDEPKGCSQDVDERKDQVELEVWVGLSVEVAKRIPVGNLSIDRNMFLMMLHLLMLGLC
jgi:hypothetical protein